MEKRLTLEDLAVMIQRGFSDLNKRILDIEHRLDRLELTVYQIQTDVDGIHGEMRGIHRVLDYLDGRTTRMEDHLGLTPS